jgi:hypothetical protein
MKDQAKRGLKAQLQRQNKTLDLARSFSMPSKPKLTGLAIMSDSFIHFNLALIVYVGGLLCGIERY